jgi:hypothetical protein
MTTPPTRGLGRGHTHGDNDIASVPRPADTRELPRRPAPVVFTDQARSIRLHHVLRRRRWSKALDQLLNPAPMVDPWTWAEPVGDPYHDLGLDLGVPERIAAGRELVDAGWTP